MVGKFFSRKGRKGVQSLPSGLSAFVRANFVTLRTLRTLRTRRSGGWGLGTGDWFPRLRDALTRGVGIG